LLQAIKIKIKIKGLTMAFTGASNINTGSQTGANLQVEMELGILSAFERANKFMPLIWRQTLVNSPAGRFVVEGKEDTIDTNLATYARGTQIDVTGGTQDEIIITSDRPTYVARRLDKFEQKTASYDVLAMYRGQMGKKLASSIDRKILSAIELSSLSTGLVSNGDGSVVVNTTIASALTPELKGDAICEAIYASIATLKSKDVDDEIYIAMSPVNYGYIVQSKKAVDVQYSGDNGSFAARTVKQVAGATIIETNNMPATANLQALAFTKEAAGMVEVWDITVDTDTEGDFLNATRITASYANGIAPVRPACAVSIKSA
jgi:hypothetical protein